FFESRRERGEGGTAFAAWGNPCGRHPDLVVRESTRNPRKWRWKPTGSCCPGSSPSACHEGGRPPVETRLRKFRVSNRDNQISKPDLTESLILAQNER